MKVALVLLHPKDIDPLFAFLADSGLASASLSGWNVEGDFFLPEQLLPALEHAFHASETDIILFPGGAIADELASRLAWRLRGSAVCQVTEFCPEAGTVVKAVYGGALTATFEVKASPLCLSLAEGVYHKGVSPLTLSRQQTLVPDPLREGLLPPQTEKNTHHPLETARRVLACGQGTVGVETSRLAKKIGAEEGYSRQRIMSGGCDGQRMLGISGQKIAPALCLVAGASGASAFLAGIAGSDFIVAINHDPAAPVFAAADVGIVGDVTEVLEALAEKIS